MGHLTDLARYLEQYDIAVKALDDYVNTFYAPYQLDEPVRPGDRMYNNQWYAKVHNLKMAVQRTNEDLIGALRRELEGMT